MRTDRQLSEREGKIFTTSSVSISSTEQGSENVFAASVCACVCVCVCVRTRVCVSKQIVEKEVLWCFWVLATVMKLQQYKRPRLTVLVTILLPEVSL